jgi:curli biogenesis system outer membrane secretion channel CsgG
MDRIHSKSLYLLSALLMTGCATMRPTTFVHPAYDFSFVERIAVVPLENLTQDRGAGERVSRYFVSELLATEAFDVVEPGEAAKGLVGLGLVRTAEMTREQVRALGVSLNAQAVILGSVTESATIRTGATTESIVSLDVRLVETETGETVWSTTHTQKGRGPMSLLFGTSGKSLGEVTRHCVERAVGELVK